MKSIDYHEMLREFARKGWGTSEFWLSVFVIAIWPIVDEIILRLTDTVAGTGAIGQVIAGGVAAAYAIARGIVKAAGLRALLTNRKDVVVYPLEDPASTIVEVPQ